MNILVNDKSHPTIKDIYNKVHLLEPTIGQATVYRNVKNLVNSGKLKRLSINNEVAHYDGDISDHYHFICTSCNKIIDIYGSDIKIPMNNIEKSNNVTINNLDIVLYGKCDKCKASY